jgi:hypothetical protein
MRTLLLLLLLVLPALAQPVSIKNVEWNPVKVEVGQRFKAKVILTGPAPSEGAKVIFEPTFNVVLPTQVIVPAGETFVEFMVDIEDTSHMSGYSGVGEAGFGDMTRVTAH